jgi:hypothetical protein
MIIPKYPYRIIGIDRLIPNNKTEYQSIFKVIVLRSKPCIKELFLKHF